jgi:hypothetical protein
MKSLLMIRISFHRGKHRGRVRDKRCRKAQSFTVSQRLINSTVVIYSNHPGAAMKSKSLPSLLLINSLLSTGYAHHAPSAEVSETVIASLLPDASVELPWRLDHAWQGGELGGAALRAASIEHVVRQVDNLIQVSSSGSNLSSIKPGIDNKAVTLSKPNDKEAVKRAWRKYCHHQLDMTAEDHALIDRTPVPKSILKQGCNPKSLLK